MNIYSEAIKSIQFLVLITGPHVNGCVEMFLLSIFFKRLALQNTNENCFAVINNGVVVLNLNSIVPIKTRFAHGKLYSELHKCLVLMSLSTTTSLCNQKPPVIGFKLNLKFYLSQIIFELTL